MRRSIIALTVVLMAAFAVTGAAASLGVTGDRVDSFGADQAAAAGDATAPGLTTLQFFDASPVGAPNGKVDTVVATFNETLASYTAGTGPWTVTNAPGGAGNSLSSVSVSGAVATLNLNEGNVNTAPGSGPTAFTLSLAANANGIRDASGNQSSFTDALVTDKAAPIASAAEVLDTETPFGDGRVDRIDVTFIGEDLVPTASPNLAAWTKSGGPAGMSASPTSGSISTTKATLSFGEGGVDTSANGLQLALTGSATGPRDAAGNQAAFASRAVTDKARPIPTSVLVSNKAGGNDGKPEVDDFITVVFSEALDRQSICANVVDTDWTNAAAGKLDDDHQVTATFTNATTDVLSASSAACTGGLKFGSLTFTSQGYSTASATTSFGGASGNQSELSWTPATSTLVLILGAPDQVTGDVNSSSENATYTPNAAMADLAGNLVAGTVNSGNARQF